MRTNNQHNPVLVLVTDRHGDVLYPPPIKMMRDHLGLSQRSMARQATRETMPRNVTPPVRPLSPAPKSGWWASLLARIWR